MIAYLVILVIFSSLSFALRCNRPMDTYKVFNDAGDNTGIACVYDNPVGSPKLAFYIEGRYQGTPYRVLGYVDATWDNNLRGRAITPANPDEASVNGPLDISISINPNTGVMALTNAAGSNSPYNPSGAFGSQQFGQILMQKTTGDVPFNKLPKSTSCGLGNTIYMKGSGSTIEYRCLIGDLSGNIKAALGPGLYKGANYTRVIVVNDSRGSASSDRCFNVSNARENCGIHNYDGGIKAAILNPDGSVNFGKDRYTPFTFGSIQW